MSRVLIGEWESEKLYNSLKWMGVDADLVETAEEGSMACAEEISREYSHLIIPGGGDVDPSFYGQDNAGSMKIRKDLDILQFDLFRAFVKAGKPVLGICRGCQVINVCLGGDLIQDLPTAKLTHARIEKDVERYHEAESVPGSVMDMLYGKHMTVNSSHHQGCSKMAEGLVITMRATDGVVEAFEHTDLPVYGVQWHPERMGFTYGNGDILDGSRLFTWFLGL